MIDVKLGDSTVHDSQYLLGIDGGGTGCRARLTDFAGKVLGEGVSGPANLALGLPIALESVMTATREALTNAQLGEKDLKSVHAGFGMAAGNVPKHRQAFERAALPFLSVSVRSDAETACLGAHAGQEGGILILGTGSQGVVHRNGTFTTVGGWGFALSDAGSGAILGRAAVRRAFLAHEGIERHSALTECIMTRFNSDLSTMLEWAESARPADWAEFARWVFQYSDSGDAIALELVRESASGAERMLQRLLTLGAERIALMGGLARAIRPYLSTDFDDALVKPMGDAMDGALILARQAAGLRTLRSEEFS